MYTDCIVGEGFFDRCISTYSFGFNGKEHIDEIYGKDNAYDYGMRFYDPRLGRPFSPDPLERKFPYLSPYQFFSDNPIANIDLDGMEGINAQNSQAAAAVDQTLAVSGATSTDKTQNIPAADVASRAKLDIYGKIDQKTKNGGTNYTSATTIPGHPLSYGDWKSQAGTKLKNDKIDVNWSKKQWKQAYSNYQALASDKTVEVEVVQATTGASNTMSPGNYTPGTTVVPGQMQTQNSDRDQFIQNAKANGQATQGDVNTLFNSSDITQKGSGWIFLDNQNTTTNTGMNSTQGDIIINGTGAGTQQNANTLGSALQSLYPQ